MTEKNIENRIIRDPGALGYANAGKVRNVRVSPTTGRVDLMILPQSGRTKLVLVEVKRAGADDAASKVAGQLIMYYVASLQIGLRGLARIRRFASEHQPAACSPSNTSLNMLAGGARSGEVAWRLLREGRKLVPKEIALFVALDGAPPRQLVDTLRFLKKNHSLRIRRAIADRRSIRVSLAV
ncbi:MAG TPA: hypothetical protein VGA37_14305 [Gemmatimonadales bacterium]